VRLSAIESRQATVAKVEAAAEDPKPIFHSISMLA